MPEQVNLKILSKRILNLELNFLFACASLVGVCVRMYVCMYVCMFV